MMLSPHMISSTLSRVRNGIARLFTWVIFSTVYYFVIEFLPFDFMGSVVIGGWLGTAFEILHIVAWVAIIFLYLYYSIKIFFEKDFFFIW